MKKTRTYFYWALVFWALVATYGLIVRYHLWHPLPIDYMNWLNAHSHAAFLGWLHAGFMIFLTYTFMPAFLSEHKAFGRLFVFMQLLVAGMLVSFPLQGYKAASITLLSLFLLATYVWAYWFLRRNEKKKDYPLAFSLARAAVWMMILSSLSPWMLGPVMVFLGKDSIWYNLDVYFYLHFQYNGWFFLALLSLGVYLLEKQGLLEVDERDIKKITSILVTAVLLGYITNTLWTRPPLYFNFLALLSVALEAWGLWLIWRRIRPYGRALSDSRLQKELLILIGTGLAGKVIFQFMASCPYFSHLAYTIRDFIIGYLHWVFLGTYSVFLLYWMDKEKIFRLDRRAFRMFFAGYAWMIFFIFIRGTLMWLKIIALKGLPAWIFWATALMYTGILWIVYDAHRQLYGNKNSAS